MLTMNDVLKLASRPERAENSVLTVYLDVDQSQQANLNRGFEKQFDQMLRSVQERIHSEHELRAFQTASSRAQEFVRRYQIGARGLAMVFDNTDGFFWGEEMDFPIRNQARWGRQVLVQPLAVAVDEYEPVGIVLLDRGRLRLFTMALGQIEEHISEEFDHRKVRHIKTVGTNHLGSSSHAQRKADEQVRLNLRHVARDMNTVLERRGVRRIILGGDPEILAELEAVLPKRLASEVIGTIGVATTAGIEDIRRAASPIAQKYERDTEETIVADIVTLAAKSGRVVVGLGHTLYALNQRRVWQLVYADELHAPGYECQECDALFALETESCPFCGSGVSPVDDVVERAVDQALRRGARIEVIRSDEAESSLMNAGGIGAFLRTRTASALVS